MRQHSGFENRFIDAYCYSQDTVSKDMADTLHISEVLPHLPYAQIFKQNDSTSLTIFPGIKNPSFSADTSQKDLLSSANIILPVALLFVVLLFIFLKNTLKSSVGSLFLIGIFPKALQETERRQIERNTLIINIINIISFFSMAFILYAVAVRFNFIVTSFRPSNISENIFYITLFFAVIGVVFLFFYARGGFISLFGNIFSAAKIMKGYRKQYKLLFVSLSPVLLSVALFTAFAPFSVMNFVSFYISICILLCYIVFTVISLLKFLNFTNRYTVHIFLYLCTLEILPFLLMVKFMQSVCF